MTGSSDQPLPSGGEARPGDGLPAAGPSDAGGSGATGRATPGAAGSGSVLVPPGAELCPNCAQPVAADAVVCTSCGYDYQANRVIRVETDAQPSATSVSSASASGGAAGGSARVRGGDRGSRRDAGAGSGVAPSAAWRAAKSARDMLAAVAPAERGDPATWPEFVVPGLGGPRLIGVIGAITLAGAMVVAGISAPAGAGAPVIAARVALVPFQALLHTGTGLLALAAVAWLAAHRFGRVDLAAARMVVAVGAFLLALQTPVAVPYVGVLLSWGAGLAAYWVVVMLLFRRTAQEAMLVLAVHLVLFLVVHAAVYLEAFLRAVAAATPGAGAGAGAGG